MSKKAFIFPGQGSQFSGMGKDLYDSNPLAKELMDRANEILGFNITDIMFYGSDEQLRATKVTQPAIFIHSVCAALCDSQKGKPDMVAGHSLGEFSALVACGSVNYEDALKLVALRSEQMQLCCESIAGTMAAIINLSDDIVEDVCSKVEGIVVPANYNSKGQIVISGEVDAVEQACAMCKEAGAKRALKLSVSGAFHSPLMEKASIELAKAIDITPITTPQCPIYQNVSAKPETNPAVIKNNLLKQLTSPVLWTQTVLNMHNDGASEFVEYGPGTVLTGLIKRILV